MTYITNALNAYAGLPQGAAFLVMLPAKTVSGRGGPQAILLNIQYTLLMMLHVYIVDQLQVGLHPTIDLTPTAVMRLATMTRMYWWCHGPLGTGLQQSSCSMPKLNHPEICVQSYLRTISTIQGDFRKIICETLNMGPRMPFNLLMAQVLNEDIQPKTFCVLFIYLKFIQAWAW